MKSRGRPVQAKLVDADGRTRRLLLKTAIAAVCSPSTSTLADNTEPDNRPLSELEKSSRHLFISGARRPTDQHVAVVFDENGNTLVTVPLTARAHGAAAHQTTQRACLFARRPGLYINAFDIRTPQTHQIILPAQGRHYYGHGTFSDAGNILFVTENDFDGARGVIGLYDADNGYQRLTEIPSAGTGPHEIIRIPGSPLLVVANGGIETHPNSGRDKLNIASMHPSLSIIDSRDGRLLGQHFLPDSLHQMSIRHLACTANDEVWFAGQYEGTDPLIDGLAGVISIEKSVNSFQLGKSRTGLTLIDLPADLQVRCLHYLSSVAVAGQHAIYTSAKGGLSFRVNRHTRQVEDSVSVFDCSGVAPLPHSATNNAMQAPATAAALLTTGTGEILRFDESGTTHMRTHNLQWDNHVYQIA
ncbi:MAG: DUF1513 domain-containing protein [Granulosicoccus sp.]